VPQYRAAACRGNCKVRPVKRDAESLNAHGEHTKRKAEQISTRKRNKKERGLCVPQHRAAACRQNCRIVLRKNTLCSARTSPHGEHTTKKAEKNAHAKKTRRSAAHVCAAISGRGMPVKP